LEAVSDSIPKATACIGEQLETPGCPMKAWVRINKLFGSIARCAYGGEIRSANKRYGLLSIKSRKRRLSRA
jgi:hypothetical protein